MTQLTAAEFKEWIREGHEFTLIDVREGWEREAFNIGGLHIPMGELPARMNEIPTGTDVIIYCAKGIRSVIAIQRLESTGRTRLFNLAGGMYAWQMAHTA